MIDSDSEDEMEADTGMMDENLFNKVRTLFEANNKFGGDKFVESVCRGASKPGYEKTLPPLLDALNNERAEKSSSICVSNPAGVE